MEELATKEASHPLKYYVVQFWGDHIRRAGPQVHDAANRYSKDPPGRIIHSVYWAADIKHYEKWDVRRTVHPLHICVVRILPGLLSQIR